MFRISSVIEGISGALLIAVCFLLAPLMLERYRRWGATDAETSTSLPGDEYISKAKGDFTQAITIRASAADVWPWIVQIGQGRGGFYTYEFLENLAGCKIHNADSIIPELQNLNIGDLIYMHPKATPLPVTVLEKDRALVIGYLLDQETGDLLDLDSNTPEKFVKQSWLWYLREENERTTRLITRLRVDHSPGLGNRLGFGPITGIISSVMSRKMLLGIKKRAEAATRES